MYIPAMTRIAPLLKVDRHKKILTIVNARKRISLQELEGSLHSSRITVQRDLVELENRNLLRRFHGGAMSIEFSGDVYNYDIKKNVQIEVKKKIAEKANRLLRGNSTICLDGSSTVYYLSETIFPARVIVLACSVDAFRNLSAREDIQAICSGGRLHARGAFLYGPEMLATIRNFHFDIAFISAEAFVPGRGFFDPHEDAVAVKRALIESSEKTVMMIDASKITPAPGIRVCENSAIDTVVTDDPTNPHLRKLFKGRLL